jgi:hypothetical protein
MMSLVNFITANPDLVGLIVTTIGGLLWHRGQKTKENDYWETFMKIGRQILPRLLQDKRIYNDAWVREELTSAIFAGLARLKIPRNTLTESLVAEAVEHLHGELAELLTTHHLDEFIKVQGKTAEVLGSAQ